MSLSAQLSIFPSTIDSVTRRVISWALSLRASFVSKRKPMTAAEISQLAGLVKVRLAELGLPGLKLTGGRNHRNEICIWLDAKYSACCVLVSEFDPTDPEPAIAAAANELADWYRDHIADVERAFQNHRGTHG